jgi:hypothetical protein
LPAVEDEEEIPAVEVSATEDGVSELMRRKIGIRIGKEEE